MGPAYCDAVCDAMKRCAAEANPEWEGGCLSKPLLPLLANQFAWYVFQRCFTQWDTAGMDGTRIALKYEPVIACIEEAGYHGMEFFDQLERIQVLELAYLSIYSQAREIERKRKQAEDDFKKKSEGAIGS